MSDSNFTLTAERLRELFHYEPSTGIFTRLVKTSRRVYVGDVAGSKNSEGYLQIVILRSSYKAHRLAWLYVHGTWPENQIDHINGQRDDNRIENLRDVTQAGNLQNQRVAQRHNKAGKLLGVSRRGAVFQSSITIDGKKRWVGTFPTAELAHEAYVALKRNVHPGCTI